MLRRISVVGLGYVGLPVAVAFAEQGKVIAFDINATRIAQLREGMDVTKEVDLAELGHKNLHLTCDPQDLQQADFHIIAVPTPINAAKQPDLTPLLGASKTVGQQLKKGDIVVYESTVYPGATEEDCVPVLERESGLVCGQDFFVGYSPERINPGDKERTFKKITKIVSGQTPEILDIVADTYSSVVKAGVFKASSIKVAEAAKVIENTQRDLNIALVNELAVIFNEMDIDTVEVLEAAGSKWNFLPFRPGIVGGHCIGVDPYYLTHKAELIGHHPQVILAGRRINDGMGKFIAEQTIKQIIKCGGSVSKAKIGVLGFAFKENCPDIRNTRVIDIIGELKEYTQNIMVCDPVADAEAAQEEYGVEFVPLDSLQEMTALIVAVAHDPFKQLSAKDMASHLNDVKLVIDVKNVVDAKALAAQGVHVWRL